MKHLLTILIVLGLLWLPASVHSEASPPMTEEAVQAEMILNFALVVEWPPFAPDFEGKKLICALSQNGTSNQLEQLLNASHHQGAFSFKRLHSPAQSQFCHILYIGEDKRYLLQEALEATQKFPVLTMSNIRQFADNGGMVGFLEAEKNIGLFSEKQIRFAINVARAAQVYLTLDPLLVELASSVVGEN